MRGYYCTLVLMALLAVIMTADHSTLLFLKQYAVTLAVACILLGIAWAEVVDAFRVKAEVKERDRRNGELMYGEDE